MGWLRSQQASSVAMWPPGPSLLFSHKHTIQVCIVRHVGCHWIQSMWGSKAWDIPGLHLLLGNCTCELLD